MNGSTATATATERRVRRRSAWQLPELIQPLRPPARRRRRRRPPLPDFAPELLAWVYRRRFATGAQIATRFPNVLPSERTEQRKLAALVERGLLAYASTRGTSPHFPRVFVITGRGLRVVRELYQPEERGWTPGGAEENRSRGRALLSVVHEVMATEFELAVEITVAGRPDLRLLMSERRYHRREHRLTFEQLGRTFAFEPDIGILVDGQFPQLNLVEIDAGTTPPRRIRDKLARLHLWTCSPQSEEYLTGLQQQYALASLPHVRMLWVAKDKDSPDRDQKRAADVLTEALALPKAVRDRLWIAAASNFVERENIPAPLTAPVWMRARHARSWMASYHAFKETLSDGPHRKAGERAFVSRQLTAMQRHSLFPAEGSPDAFKGSERRITAMDVV